MADSPEANPASGGRLAKYREKLIDAAVLTLPLSYVTAGSTVLKDRLLTEPWKVLWIVVPLVAAAWFTWRRIISKPAGGADAAPSSRLDWRWFVFLGIYCSVFALASTSDLLVWKRLPPGYYQNAPEAGRAWAVPLQLGDWRYSFVKRVVAEPNNLVVLLFDPLKDATRERARLRDRHLIELASSGNAAGIAFDVAYEGASSVDTLFCASMRRSGFHVVSTYDLTSASNALLARKPPTKAVMDCLPVSMQGHAMGFAEGDGKVRAIPLYWEGDRNAPAFSVRVAQLMHGAQVKTPLAIPDSTLLRFIPPARDIPVIVGDQLGRLEEDPKVLQNYFVIVGERSKADTFQTPFGPLSGAAVHAYAVHSLLTGSEIRRPSALSSAFIVFASCYVLTLLASGAASASRLMLGALVLSVAIAGLSFAAIYFWRVWLDVVYAVVAIWLLVPLLLAMRRVTIARSAPE